MYWDTLDSVSGSNFTTTSTSLVDITGLSRALVANSTYEVEVFMRYQNSGTNAIQFALAYSAAGATGTGWFSGNQSNTTAINAMQDLGTAEGSSYGLVATTNFMATVRGLIVTGANAGNLTVQTIHTSSGTTTIYIGSVMKIKKLA